jgi:predicted nucleic-acid-binding Zn-ribbon protein
MYSGKIAVPPGGGGLRKFININHNMYVHSKIKQAKEAPSTSQQMAHFSRTKNLIGSLRSI